MNSTHRIPSRHGDDQVRCAGLSIVDVSRLIEELEQLFCVHKRSGHGSVHCPKYIEWAIELLGCQGLFGLFKAIRLT